ncbi:MAG: type II toxin-antitoxin system RelB/DinJ family antitoxin [Hyphomicrobiales bacterium]
MSKTAVVRARIEPALKQDAEHILSRLGLTSSEAIGIFFRQVTIHRGLPFSVTIPNEATAKAIAETRRGKGTRTFASAKDWAKAARRG